MSLAGLTHVGSTGHQARKYLVPISPWATFSSWANRDLFLGKRWFNSAGHLGEEAYMFLMKEKVKCL